jgi:hypothetical protein
MSQSRPFKLEIDCQGIGAQAAVEELKRALPEPHRRDVALDVPPSRRQPDGLALDPAMIVALISGGTTVLAATISALVTIVVQRGARKMILSRADGTKLEVPVPLSAAQTTVIMAAMQGGESARIVIPR